MREIVPIWSVLSKARADLNALLQAVRARPAIDPLSPKGLDVPENGNIRFENVSFAYPSRPVSLSLMTLASALS
jgi:ATP-binding cassette, subfamily B, bacterial